MDAACDIAAGPYSPGPGIAIERAASPHRDITMPIRVRKLIGTVALLALIVVWTILAMAFAYAVFRGENPNPIIAAIYYIVAGIGWVLPAMPLISWMLRPDPEQS
jgi:O-antigen/teichoic acid export membrane protein